MQGVVLEMQVKTLQKKVLDREKVMTLMQVQHADHLEKATERLKETVAEQALEIKRLKTANERLETTLSAASKCMATALSATKK